MSGPFEHRLRIGDRALTLLEGPAGWGECSPLPGYPCSPAAARRAAEEAACDGWPRPVRSRVPVSGLVIGDEPVPSGFSCVKVKVGRGGDDVARVARVRDAIGATAALRIDANGAWDLDTATLMLDRLKRFDLELAEQPVAGLDDLAVLRRRVDVALAADESIRTVDDARRLARLEAADVIVLKVQPLGGVRGALRVAEAAGVPALVTSMLETSVGLAAGVALAAALPELPYACGLATLGALDGDVTRAPLEPVDGAITVRAVVPDSDLLDRYRTIEEIA